MGARGVPDLEAAWHALYQGCPDALITAAADGSVLAGNPTALAWFGNEIVASPLRSVFADDDAELVERLARTGWVGVSERRFLLNDGRTVSIGAARIDGLSWQLVVRDVTTRQALDDAEDQRRRLSTLAEFAGALARELNDPMSIVQGRLELLLEIGETDPAAIERHLRIALDHARRISATLRNLRMVGQTPVSSLGRVYLGEAVEEALDLVGPRIRGVELELSVPEDLAVGGDTAMCARVLANLLNHAVDLSSRGGFVGLKARVGDDRVLVHLATGRIGEAALAQAVPERITEGHGGLGLSVAATLVAAMGGELVLQRSGQTVVFTCAFARAPDRPGRARPVIDRLLVVGCEDLERCFTAVLGRDGFSIERVATAEEALERVADHGFDAVATDLFLEGMSGLSLVEELARRHTVLRGRLLLVTDAKLPATPAHVVALRPPLERTHLLELLGRRVRRRR